MPLVNCFGLEWRTKHTHVVSGCLKKLAYSFEEITADTTTTKFMEQFTSTDFVERFKVVNISYCNRLPVVQYNSSSDMIDNRFQVTP